MDRVNFELEICPSRDMAGISRNFIVSRLLVWSWKMLHDMVLKINLINFFVAKDESAEKIEYLFLWSFIWLWLVGPIQTFQCSCFRRMCSLPPALDWGMSKFSLFWVFDWSFWCYRSIWFSLCPGKVKFYSYFFFLLFFFLYKRQELH